MLYPGAVCSATSSAPTLVNYHPSYGTQIICLCCLVGVLMSLVSGHADSCFSLMHIYTSHVCKSEPTLCIENRSIIWRFYNFKAKEHTVTTSLILFQYCSPIACYAIKVHSRISRNCLVLPPHQVASFLTVCHQVCNHWHV